MAELSREVLQEQMALLAAKIIALERHDRGYQGPIEVDDLEVVVRVKCGDGKLRRIDPSEIGVAHPRAFVRDFVTLGERIGVSVIELLERFLPIVSPKASTTLNWLKGLWK